MHSIAILLIEVGALLVVAGFLSRFGKRIGLSPIPLYLVLGLLVGSSGMLSEGSSTEFLEVGSELGVILLLVMLGLEYSASELVTNLKRSRAGGIIDFVANGAPGFAFGMVFGWGVVASVALAGITYVSSSGVIAKVMRDLGRLGNRETPTILSILVIEDLVMAFYLPILSVLLIGAGLVQGGITLGVSLLAVVAILLVALKFGDRISRLFSAEHPESLLLGVLGLTLLVAGIAQQVNVSSAVGAFLVGIALSGKVALKAEKLLSPLRDLFAAAFFLFFGLSTHAADMVPMIVPALILALVTMGTKVWSGYWAAKWAGIGVLGRWRSGFTLTARGEFSIVIAGLAVSAGAEPLIAPLATAYVLLTVMFGPLVARIPEATWFKNWVIRD
ncbi:MAG: cation:proton antiporter [Microbacteriaceae bacterium]